MQHFRGLVLTAPSDAHFLQTDHAGRQQETANFQLGGPENSLEPTTRGTRCRKMEVWRTHGTWTMVTFCVTPILVPSCLQEIDVANAKVGAEWKPTKKKEVIHYVNDLDAAPPEWRNGDVQSPQSPSESVILGVAVGPRQFIADLLRAKADVRAVHERVQVCQDSQTEFALLRESLGVSRINHILPVHGHTIMQEQRAAESYDEVGQQSLERFYSAQATPESATRERETLRLHHTLVPSWQQSRASKQ